MRLLIISPHFPPTNAADMQRVRLILPYLSGAGIQAEVLVVDSGDVASPMDAWLVDGLPADLPVHRVRALGLKWSRIPGLGTLGFRAIRALAKAGDRLLKHKHFDLIYFSTTVFAVHALGPRWKKKYGVPFVLDYQDPWVSDYYRGHPEITPPGGRLKYGVVDWLNRRLEPNVLRQCSGITSVSAAYPGQLQSRYPWLDIVVAGGTTPEHGDQGPDGGSQMPQRGQQNEKAGGAARHSLHSIVLPFPGDVMDLERVRSGSVRQQVFDVMDGHRHWVYVGRGGEDMQKACSAVFAALVIYEKEVPGFLSNLRIHFVGTSYAAAGGGRKTLEGLAASMALGEVVSEHTDRIPYSEAMRCLLDADALVVLGSDDPGYTASKIYPYLLAGKPLLAVFHEMSSVVELTRRCGGAVCVPFTTSEEPDAVAGRIVSSWLRSGAYGEVKPFNEDLFAPHTAQSGAKALEGLFTKILTF